MGTYIYSHNKNWIAIYYAISRNEISRVRKLLRERDAILNNKTKFYNDLIPDPICNPEHSKQNGGSFKFICRVNSGVVTMICLRIVISLYFHEAYMRRRSLKSHSMFNE